MVALQQASIDLIGSSTFGVNNKISAAQTWNMYISDGFFINYPGWKKVLQLSSSIGTGGLNDVRGFTELRILISFIPVI